CLARTLCCNHPRIAAIGNVADFEMATATMAFSSSILFPAAAMHSPPQITQNQTVHRNRCLNLAKLTVTSMALSLPSKLLVLNPPANAPSQRDLLLVSQ
ncbi:MAG: hypothetical protein KDE53_17880, partial [Caldilineaceae bacterium]|nr:hypothetical protein [Caldilineaceae bacterium]